MKINYLIRKSPEIIQNTVLKWNGSRATKNIKFVVNESRIGEVCSCRWRGRKVVKALPYLGF